MAGPRFTTGKHSSSATVALTTRIVRQAHDILQGKEYRRPYRAPSGVGPRRAVARRFQRCLDEPSQLF
jgi:hypothetical protein